MIDDYASKPYAEWLEDTVREMFDIDPVSIALEMRDDDGKTYTCYWEVSADDRAIMIDSMKEDCMMEWVVTHKDEILSILNEGGGDDDGLCETDTETDREG